MFVQSQCTPCACFTVRIQILQPSPPGQFYGWLLECELSHVLMPYLEPRVLA